jgi:HK97 family phage portal protein
MIEGYQQNPDVYAIIDKLTNMYAAVRYKQVVVDKNGKYEDYHDNVIQDIIDNPNPNQCGREFENEYYMFYLTMGDACIYAPKLEAGNNAGKLLPTGMFSIPTQYMWIYAEDWTKPVKEYVINYNQGPQYRMPASDVIHMRMPNPEYKNGNNLYGLSPIVVATDLVRMMLAAYSVTKAIYQNPFPPGILSKKDPDQSNNGSTNESTMMRRLWRTKYGSGEKAAREPIFTAGDLQWTKLGFDNIRDLDLEAIMTMGLRRLCNMWGIPSELLNDANNKKYANVNEARKMAYTNRIIPDKEIAAQKFNNHLWKNYGMDRRIRLIPDWNTVPELQDDKLIQSQILDSGIKNGSFTRNEFREGLGYQKSDDPALDVYTAQTGTILLDEVAMGQVPPDPNLAD